MRKSLALFVLVLLSVFIAGVPLAHADVLSTAGSVWGAGAGTFNYTFNVFGLNLSAGDIVMFIVLIIGILFLLAHPLITVVLVALFIVYILLKFLWMVI